MAQEFNWLHISDLHAGQLTQDWLWPTLQTQFFEDFKRIKDKVGPIDFVIFSGDLTQSGSEEDFVVLRGILQRIWQELDNFGSTPELFAVPGNHDLVRPASGNSHAMALRSWWANSEVRSTFWKDPKGDLRKTVDEFFSNYSKFIAELPSFGIPTVQIKEGLLPGDSSAIIKKGSNQIGLVGLNSAFLHFFDEDVDPSLDVHARQLMSVTNDNPDDWVKKNCANLLITHHPLSWLHSEGKTHFQSEINPPGRFSAHLFGHMHQNDVQSIAMGGSRERRSIQAPSLFGLRKLRNSSVERSHGYSASKLTIGETACIMRIWPRTTQVVGAGARRFVPDTRLDLDEDNSFSLQCLLSGTTPGLATAASVPEVSLKDATQDAAELPDIKSSPLLFRLKLAPFHSSIRIVEQRLFRQALIEKSAAWLVSDWNYGSEEFLWSVFNSLDSILPLTFHFSLSGYSGRESFFTEFRVQAGCSFPEFSKSVAGQQRIILVLDDVPVHNSDPERGDAEFDIEDLVEAFLDYCPNSLIVLSASKTPNTSRFPVVALKPLEEADVKSYLTQIGGVANQYSDASSISDIFRITEGLPLEIDQLLRQLQYASLSDILEDRSKSESSASLAENGQKSLQVSISRIRNSSDPVMQRAFRLLRVLAIFPIGETVARLRNLESPNPFHWIHAEILDAQGFVEVQSVSPTMEFDGKIKSSPVVRVKKSVKDLILAEIEPELSYELNKKAACVYFGDQCFTGTPKNLKTSDLLKTLGGSALENPHRIIVSLLKSIVNQHDNYRYQQVMKLAHTFAIDLEHGDNFRSSVAFCQDLLRVLPNVETYQKDISWFKYKLGASMRMLGGRDASTAIFSELDLSMMDRTTKRRILINWALAEQASNPEKAKDIAKEVISLGKGSFQALEAEFIILKNSPDDTDRIAKLKALELRVTKKNIIGIMNNIGLYLDEITENSPSERCRQLEIIGQRAAKNNDRYTFARAYVRLGKISSRHPQSIDYGISSQIAAYQYLYEERMDALFSEAHQNLWRQFLNKMDIDNILRLFRHSSYIWRLSGKESKEIPYINAIIKVRPDILVQSALEKSIELNYFVVRAEKMQPLLGLDK